MSNGETYDSLVEEANQLTWVYGNDVTWNGSEYTLVDTVESKPMEWSTDRTSVVGNGHRYTCLSDSNTCNTVYYVHYTGTTNYVYYMTLKDGKNISDALNEMFPDDNNLRNQTDSTIKKKVDEWYETNMVDYTKYLEDTVWCNDRSIYQLNSWDKDYSGTGYLYFGPYGRAYSSYNPTTTCSNINDSFTVSSEKGNGKLTYPVALLTADEIMLAGGRGSSSNSSYYLYTGQTWWSLSPRYYNSYSALGFLVNSAGNLNYNDVNLVGGAGVVGGGDGAGAGDGGEEIPDEETPQAGGEDIPDESTPQAGGEDIPDESTPEAGGETAQAGVSMPMVIGGVVGLLAILLIVLVALRKRKGGQEEE